MVVWSSHEILKVESGLGSSAFSQAGKSFLCMEDKNAYSMAFVV